MISHLLIIENNSILFRVMDLWESGLVGFWVYTNVPVADQCFAGLRHSNAARQVPIQLSDLTSAFLVLGIGLGMAITCFVFEVVRYHLKIYPEK